MPVAAPRPFEEDPHILCLCDCLFITVAQRGIIIRKNAAIIFRVDIVVQAYATKYLAWGWWTMMALVLCSGSKWKPSVRRTPMFSSGLSRRKIFA